MKVLCNLPNLRPYHPIYLFEHKFQGPQLTSLNKLQLTTEVQQSSYQPLFSTIVIYRWVELTAQYPSPSLFLHSFTLTKKGSGLRYKVAIFIYGGQIFWVNGSSQCKKLTEVVIFRLFFNGELDLTEHVVADNRYPYYECIQE